MVANRIEPMQAYLSDGTRWLTAFMCYDLFEDSEHSLFITG